MGAARCRPGFFAPTGAGKASATRSVVAYLVECAHHVAREIALPFLLYVD